MILGYKKFNNINTLWDIFLNIKGGKNSQPGAIKKLDKGGHKEATNGARESGDRFFSIDKEGGMAIRTGR